MAEPPQGRTRPNQPDHGRRRARRLAAALVATDAFVLLVSSLSEPLHRRLHELHRLVPLAVPQAAAAFTGLAGLALLILARGVRRGQRRAWAITIGVLLASVVLCLAKGIDVGQAAATAIVAGVLWWRRADFGAPTGALTFRGALGRWVGALVGAAAGGTVGLQVGVAILGHAARRHHGKLFSISWAHAAQATVERMAGIYHVELPARIERFFAPVTATISAALGVSLLIVLLRPAVGGRHGAAERARALHRARLVVARWGAGTLDYFALRPDKQFFFWGQTVIAYAVYTGVCLVSPDPIGPAPEREPAWGAFRRFVDQHGWVLGVLGAGDSWLPIYRAGGMHHLYAGDEAIVRVEGFSLDGGQFKSLRQAVNRIARHGYRISFHDPAHLGPALRAGLEQVMAASRRGEVERGFSMTLGRAFDPDDLGLFLAVVHAPAPAGLPEGALGEPVAFCQYTPAPAIGGYSLDLMRRDNRGHPNGLLDFAVVETIRHLQAQGKQAVSLNFATMRAVLAGEKGGGWARRAQAWVLRRMGGSMQIESLWQFTAKFAPDWQPRYAVYDAPENAPAIALAVAHAESWWEIPLLGRFLHPAQPPQPAHPRPAGSHHPARPAYLRTSRTARYQRAIAGRPGAALLALAAVGIAATAHFDLLDGASLDNGWLVRLAALLAAAGITVGTARRGRSWWTTWGAGIAVAATLLVAAGAWWVQHSSLGGHYPPSFYLWSWAALWALGVALSGWWTGAVAVRAVRLLTAPVAVFAAFCLIQSHYGYWPTLGTLLDHPAPGQVSAAVLARDTRRLQPATLAPLRPVGRYGPLTIPSPPGFTPAQAWIWLPPDFTRVPHTHLPVMVMLTGLPGTAQDWPRAGQALAVANHWAHAHHGAAPVMIFIDENGASGHDTECVNGPQGDAETYLTHAVPTYLQHTYGITPTPDRWAVIGFSEGGTCALDLAIRHPDLYGTFADFAGDLAPNYGHEQPPAATLTNLYGNDTTAETAHDPRHILATHHYINTRGWLSAGLQDQQHAAIAAALAPAAIAAGIRLHTLYIPGGHTWKYADQAFAHIYPSLTTCRRRAAAALRYSTDSPRHQPSE